MSYKLIALPPSSQNVILNTVKGATMIRNREWDNLKVLFGPENFSTLQDKIETLNQQADPADRPAVLEVGYGHGEAADFLARKHENLSVHGIDLNGWTRQKGGRPFSFECSRGDVQALPYETRSMNVVYSAAVMPYVPDKVGALLEIYRVLKPGGHAIISIDPNYFGREAEELFPDTGSDIRWDAEKRNLIITKPAEDAGSLLPCRDYRMVPIPASHLNDTFHANPMFSSGRYYRWPNEDGVSWLKMSANGERLPYKASVPSLYVAGKSGAVDPERFHASYWQYDTFPDSRKLTRTEIQNAKDAMAAAQEARNSASLDTASCCTIM